jgi:hypothetical protein
LKGESLPTADEFWSAAEEVVSQRGHLVVGFSAGSDQPELGSMLENVLGFKPQQRVTVVEVTDWSDWKEQVETFYIVRPAWGLGSAGDPDATYYRVRFCAPGTPFLPRAAARLIDFVLLTYLAHMAGRLFRFLLAMAAGGVSPWCWAFLHTRRFAQLSMAARWVNYCSHCR